MILYSAYFDTLASIGNPDHPEWQATAAGLVVLRLINDWLDFGPNVIIPHSMSCAVARKVIAQVPEPKRIKPFLKQAVDAIERAEQSSIQVVTQPIIEYVKTLHDKGQYSLAEQALFPLLQRAQFAQNTEAIIQLSLHLGRVFRDTCQFDKAEEHYNTASHYARKIGDIPNIINSTIGELKITAQRGDLLRADTISADLVSAAKIFGDSSLFSLTLHQRAYVVSLCDDNTTAIVLLRNALKYSVATYERQPMQMDLASLLTENGQLSSARKKSVVLAISGIHKIVRWQAVCTLMYGAIKERDQATFELYKNALQLAPLEPWHAVGYRIYAAEGMQIFGDELGAQQAIQEAYTIAQSHQIHINYLNY